MTTTYDDLTDEQLNALLAMPGPEPLTPEQHEEIARVNYNLRYQIGFTGQMLYDRIKSVCGATVSTWEHLTEPQAAALIESLNATEDAHNEELFLAVAERQYGQRRPAETVA